MYHYVRPYDDEYPNFKNLDIEDFKKQLDFFEEEFGFVKKSDFLESFETKRIPEGVILTFDDGLSCHYNYVFKELTDRNLWGIFYIPTHPLVNNKILDVHRTHLLLGKYNPIEVFTFLNKIVTDSMIDKTKLEEFKIFTYNSQENDQYSLLVKRMTNYFIDYNFRSKIMDKLMRYFFPDESEICKTFYLNEAQIKEMYDQNMVIGSHTVNHPVMSRLSKEDQQTEIVSSFHLLESITNNHSYRTFCYPYGGWHSFNSITESLLKENHCKYSFNVEHRDIELNDLLNRPQALPRYDCNQFKFGQVRNNHRA